MKKKIYLHIGSAKTGTSSIQETFQENRNRLNNLGFHYPGNHVNHHFSFLLTRAEFEDWPRQFKTMERNMLKNTIEEYFQHLAEDINSSQHDAHIISSEYLFLTNETHVKNYVGFLEKFYDEIKVCMFLRNPVNYFRSEQQQVIKARSYLTKPEEWKLKFKQVIKLWGKYAEVEVIEYESGVDSCKLFCDWAGIDYSSLIPLEKKSNVSLSIEQMLLLEKIQSQLYPNRENHFKDHLRVLEHIRFTDLNKPKLKEGIRAVVYKKHKQDMVWLEENCAINFLDNELDEAMNDFCIDSETGVPSVRDLFKVPDEEMVEKYEIHVLDLVLKKLAQRATN